jgi:hypothetical protein
MQVAPRRRSRMDIQGLEKCENLSSAAWRDAGTAPNAVGNPCPSMQNNCALWLAASFVMGGRCGCHQGERRRKREALVVQGLTIPRPSFVLGTETLVR